MFVIEVLDKGKWGPLNNQPILKSKKEAEVLVTELNRNVAPEVLRTLPGRGKYRFKKCHANARQETRNDLPSTAS